MARARQRRRVYLAGIAIGVPALGISWLVADDGSWLRWLYVALSMALVGAAAAIVHRPALVPVVERATFLTVGAVWLLRLAYLLHSGGTAAQTWDALTPWVFTGVCLIAVFAYIVLPARLAALASAVVAGTATVLMVPHFVSAALVDGDWSAVQALSRSQAYLVVTLLFVHVLARTKDGQLDAELEAERMRTMAYRDPLTGLPNRRALGELLDREVDHSRRTPLSVISVDLDRFKTINDTLGHHAGDLVLQAAAMCLQNELRSGDTVGRWGGEEFLVVCPGSGLPEGARLAQRLRAALERELRVDGLSVTGSFGVAEYAAGMSVSALLAVADDRTYAAKAAGRNRVVSSTRGVARRGPLVPDQAVRSAVAHLDSTVVRLDAAADQPAPEPPLVERRSAVEGSD